MKMQSKFAKAIAANIREIAVNTTHVILLDQGGEKSNEDYCNRAECVRAVEKAERNIASLLQQPGTWQD